MRKVGMLGRYLKPVMNTMDPRTVNDARPNSRELTSKLSQTFSYTNVSDFLITISPYVDKAK